MITAAEVMPLLVEACPSFAEAWQRIRTDEYHVDDGGRRLNYADAGEFARHLVSRYVGGDLDEVQRSFDVIERMHVEGDDDVRELATIGYLEDIQNVASREPACTPEELTRFLGEESRPMWMGLNAFWSGQAPVESAANADAQLRPWWRRPKG